MFYIYNAHVVTPTKSIKKGVLLSDGDKIKAVGPADSVSCPEGAKKVDAGGKYLVPGLIEMQLNGGFGNDFTADPSTIWTVAGDLAQFGITTFLPTVITSSIPNTAKARKVVTEGKPAGYKECNPLGLHLEGPFLNPEKKGAHNEDYICTARDENIEGWSPEGGVRLVTLAPEMPDALPAIKTLADRGVVVSAGHTQATYEESIAGFDAGITYGTHLFNAMPALHHRKPGLPGALLYDERVTVGIIVDGVHVHPSLIKVIWEAIGPKRMSSVTDSLAAMGLPPGSQCRLGEYDVIVTEKVCTLADGTISGAVISLDRGLRNLIEFTGCSLGEALETMTTTPARCLGLEGKIGSLETGAQADMVLLTEDYMVDSTIVGGEFVYSR